MNTVDNSLAGLTDNAWLDIDDDLFFLQLLVFVIMRSRKHFTVGPELSHKAG